MLLADRVLFTGAALDRLTGAPRTGVGARATSDGRRRRATPRPTPKKAAPKTTPAKPTRNAKAVGGVKSPLAT